MAFNLTDVLGELLARKKKQDGEETGVQKPKLPAPIIAGGSGGRDMMYKFGRDDVPQNDEIKTPGGTMMEVNGMPQGGFLADNIAEGNALPGNVMPTPKLPVPEPVAPQMPIEYDRKPDEMMAPEALAGNTNPAPSDAPKIAEQQQSGLAKLRNQANDLYNRDYSKAEFDENGELIKHAGKDRDKNWTTWDKIGSFADGMMKGGIVEGIRAGTDRNYFEKQRDNRELAGIAPKLAMAEKQQQGENQEVEDYLKQVKLQKEAIGTDISNNEKALKLQRLEGEPYWETVKAKKEITQADADQLEKLGYGKLPVASWQALKEESVNGKPYIRKEFDPGYVRNPTLPDDPLKTPVQSKIGEDTFVSTSPQAMTARVGVEQANANRAASEAQFQMRREDSEREREYSSEKDYNDDLQSWNRSLADIRAKKTAADTKAAELEKAKDGAIDPDAINAKLIDAKADLARYAKEEEELLKQKPKKVIRKSSGSKGGKKRYSAADIDRVIRQ